MNDPHLNIFHAYRGGSPSEEVRQRQLEDNLTRSLVVTLDRVRDVNAGGSLLRALGFPAAEIGRPYRSSLQVTAAEPDWPKPEARRLVVIHAGPELERIDVAGATLAGKADAVITTSRYLVAIESKLGNRVTNHQLQRHRETLEIPGHTIHEVTWTELARAAREDRSRTKKGTVASLILAEFEEYLRMNGFGGFSEEHFAYFTRKPEDRDQITKDGIRQALSELATVIRDGWETEWDTHVGNIQKSDQEAWVKLQANGKKAAPHLTVGFAPGGIEIFANIETEPPYRQWSKSMSTDMHGLINLLRAFGEVPQPGSMKGPWRLGVVRRVPLNQPQKFQYWPAVDISIAALAAWPDEKIGEFIEVATAKPAGEAAPEIKLGRTYEAAAVLNNEQIGEALVEDARRLEPFFNWLGQPVRTRDQTHRID